MGSSLKVTNPPAHILIASRGFKRKMTDQIKRMKLATTVLGFKFKVSRFTAFLAWTGMIACVMGMLVSLALLTIPTDVEPLMQALRYQLFINDALPEDFDDQYKDVFFTMYGIGGALMAVSLPQLPMYYLLRKRNMKKDTEGVMKMLKVICYTKSVIDILTFPMDTNGLDDNNLESVQMWISVGGVAFFAIFALFTFLKIHGIRTQNTRYIKAFIIFQYIVFTLIAIVVTVGSIYLSVITSQFWIFLLGVLVMMCWTFIFILDMGSIITLNTIFKVMDRNGNVYSRVE